MANIDLDIEYQSLEELITKLEEDNRLIVAKMQKINNMLRSIDDKKWISSQKDKVDKNLMPFLDTVDRKIFDCLNGPLDALKIANNAYLDLEDEQAESSGKLGV